MVMVRVSKMVRVRVRVKIRVRFSVSDFPAPKFCEIRAQRIRFHNILRKYIQSGFVPEKFH